MSKNRGVCGKVTHATFKRAHGHLRSLRRNVEYKGGSVYHCWKCGGYHTWGGSVERSD